MEVSTALWKIFCVLVGCVKSAAAQQYNSAVRSLEVKERDGNHSSSGSS